MTSFLRRTSWDKDGVRWPRSCDWTGFVYSLLMYQVNMLQNIVKKTSAWGRAVCPWKMPPIDKIIDWIFLLYGFKYYNSFSNISFIFQIITQLEAVESGIVEINQWLDDGEALLNSFIVHGTNESMQQQHNKQKVKIHMFLLLLSFAWWKICSLV